MTVKPFFAGDACDINLARFASKKNRFRQYSEIDWQLRYSRLAARGGVKGQEWHFAIAKIA
jgi:hypothetical protein